MWRDFDFSLSLVWWTSSAVLPVRTCLREEIDVNGSPARWLIGDDDLVSAIRKDEPLRESKLLTSVLQLAAEAAGLGRVTWHQFRHIHSSPLNDLTVPVKIAQEQLGHASIATTLNICTHAVDASHRKAIEAVERELLVVVDHSGL